MKIMVGVDIGGYTFNAATKQITITGLDPLTLEQFLVITNVTDNVIIYSFNDPTLGGTVSSNVITLTYDTTLMSNTDDLQIWLEYKKTEDINVGVPDDYSESIVVGSIYNIETKGITNRFKHYIKHITEDMEGNSDLVASLDGTNTDILQLFKASADTISHLHLFAGTGGGSTVIDDMEVVTDWTSSDPTNTPIALETTIVDTGSGSLKISITDGGSANDTITKTFAAEDWSESTALKLKLYQTDDQQDIRVSVRISDGTNSKTSSEMLVSTKNVWSDRLLLFSGFTEDGGGTTNMSAITSVIFIITKDNKDRVVYIDQLIRLGDPGTFDIQIYDFASTSAPTALSQGTLKTWDDGLTTQTVQASNAKNLIMVAKLMRNLTIGNYYGIRIFNKTSLGNLDFYGESSGSYYANGKALKSIDSGVTLTNISTGNEDFYFHIYSIVDAYITKIHLHLNGTTGESKEVIIIEDSVEKVKSVVAHGSSFLNQIERDITIDVAKNIGVNDILEIYYDDDVTSSANKISVRVHACVKPHTSNG